MSELRQFRLPDVGEGLTEADIVRWLVQPGDKVTVNQIIVEIETAKAVVELPSPYQGVVADLLVAEGTTVDVGSPIIAVDVGVGVGAPPGSAPGSAAVSGAAAPSAAAAPAASRPGPDLGPVEELISSPPAEGGVEPGIHGTLTPKPERQAVLVGYGVKLGPTTRRPRKARPGDAAVPVPVVASTAVASTAVASSAVASSAVASSAVSGPAVASTAPASASGGAAADAGTAVLAKPPVRKMAKDLGVDLAALAGTGPNGSITRGDVQAAAAGGNAAGTAAAEPGGARRLVPISSLPREERIPIRGVRKHTAAAVIASAFTAPHVTEFLQIDITETMQATERLKALPEFASVRVSPLLLVARALLVAVARYPMINSAWDEAAREIVIRNYVNLGIAAATERGLIVPNVKDAHVMSLPELARGLTELTATARSGKTAPGDLSGGTITITNVGVFGVDTGTPILTPGEAAILAFGQVKDAPWVYEGQLAVRKVSTLALSFDHRIVDGDLGSAVLRDIGAMLTDPLRMLAWS